MDGVQERMSGEPTSPGWMRLAELRERIDRVDESLVAALAARFGLAQEIGTLKGGSGIAVLDPRREAEVVRKAGEAARAAGLPEEGVRQLFWGILDYCREGVRARHRLEQMLPSERGVTFGA